MTPWDVFAKEKLEKIFKEKRSVIDIGGGLRISKTKGNRYNKKNEWLLPLAKTVDYKVLDLITTYHPDIIGDIHNLPFADNSQEAIVCIAVLEHVEDPQKACKEIYRALKPGGYAFVYVPFLYYYHAEKEYYHDYWRFTKDAIRLLFKDFSMVEVVGVRGALSTWLHLSPLGRVRLLAHLFNWLDVLFDKVGSNQVSGYNIFSIK